jgi:hypothetical protein
MPECENCRKTLKRRVKFGKYSVCRPCQDILTRTDLVKKWLGNWRKENAK